MPFEDTYFKTHTKLTNTEIFYSISNLHACYKIGAFEKKTILESVNDEFDVKTYDQFTDITRYQ